MSIRFSDRDMARGSNLSCYGSQRFPHRNRYGLVVGVGQLKSLSLDRDFFIFSDNLRNFNEAFLF